ncbi:MAG: TatD family deoxyribonuclease [Sphingobacteriales bacterium]|nr:MAG: TatD family deoxyribonuclease [Sphingobacteriales bacterium]
MIDTHCHLYLPEFEMDIDEVLSRAQECNVSHFLLPNVNVETIAPLYMLCEKNASCLPMMGLHPCDVKADADKLLKKIEKELFAAPEKFIGVGEIGLDYYWDKTYIDAQKNAFRRQLQWAKELDLPVSMHTRDSFADAFEIVKEEAKDGKLKGVFHCFSGNNDDAKKVADIGFFMGIGGVITFKNGGLNKALAGLNADNLVLETDAPYLAPVPYRGKRNESAYLKQIVIKLAEVLGMETENVAKITTQNAMKVFRLS